VIWGQTARQRIECLLSIGTGEPAENAFGKGLKDIASTLIDIATETERTATEFQTAQAPTLGDATLGKNVYFRFNVTKGLEKIGLEKYEDKAKIAAATKVYLSGPEISSRIVSFAEALRSPCK